MTNPTKLMSQINATAFRNGWRSDADAHQRLTDLFDHDCLAEVGDDCFVCVEIAAIGAGYRNDRQMALPV